MRFSFAAAVAALAAGAVASDAITETVTAYTTYCPEATTIVHGSSTYSVSTVRNPFCDGWAMRISDRRMERVEIQEISHATLPTFHLILLIPRLSTLLLLIDHLANLPSSPATSP